jgi:hypothetical protein
MVKKLLHLLGRSKKILRGLVGDTSLKILSSLQPVVVCEQPHLSRSEAIYMSTQKFNNRWNKISDSCNSPGAVVTCLITCQTLFGPFQTCDGYIHMSRSVRNPYLQCVYRKLRSARKTFPIIIRAPDHVVAVYFRDCLPKGSPSFLGLEFSIWLPFYKCLPT